MGCNHLQIFQWELNSRLDAAPPEISLANEQCQLMVTSLPRYERIYRFVCLVLRVLRVYQNVTIVPRIIGYIVETAAGVM